MIEYNDIKEQLKKFIVKDYLNNSADLADDKSLFGSGIIASLALIEVLVFIQKTFGVVIEPSEVSIDNFDTIEKMAEFIKNKKSS